MVTGIGDIVSVEEAVPLSLGIGRDTWVSTVHCGREEGRKEGGRGGREGREGAILSGGTEVDSAKGLVTLHMVERTSSMCIF